MGKSRRRNAILKNHFHLIDFFKKTGLIIFIFILSYCHLAYVYDDFKLVLESFTIISIFHSNFLTPYKYIMSYRMTRNVVVKYSYVKTMKSLHRRKAIQLHMMEQQVLMTIWAALGIGPWEGQKASLKRSVCGKLGSPWKSWECQSENWEGHGLPGLLEPRLLMTTPEKNH